MSVALLKQSRVSILLSINAVAILLAGILVASAIWLNGGVDFRLVGERSDIVAGTDEHMELLESASQAGVEAMKEYGGYTYQAPSYELNDMTVPKGEIWNEKTMTMYATADIDICVGGGLSDLGEMYWQTSDTSVIAGFYNSARTWLGYDNATCRYPVVAGTGVVDVTVGTYDGSRRDTIQVYVVEPPAEQWKREVLSLVNNIRANNELGQLNWGVTCENAAMVRAKETMEVYSHTRPDGTSWATACPAPESGGVAGENLAVGNAAVSPVTVVMLWMGSDSHRENILNPEFTKLSVGFLFDIDSKYKTHWSQFFATY